MIGGMIAHARRDPDRAVRPLLNQMHRIFGGITMVLGWTNICIGVYDHPSWPVWFKWAGLIAYWAFIGIVFGRSEALLWRRASAQPIPAE